MRPPFPWIALLLIAHAICTGCATVPARTAPGCQGPRRPANPYGSVLTDGAAAPATTPAEATPSATVPIPCASGPR